MTAQQVQPVHLVLVGLMGAGKSATGRIVADRHGVEFVDVDDAIESRTGTTVEELWRRGGEDAYRDLERAITVATLGRVTSFVLAAPGRVVSDPESLAALCASDASVVYLRADPTIIAGRLAHDSHRRPLLGAEPRTVLDRMFAERDQRYAEVADLVVTVDEITAVGAAEIILRSGVIERPPPVRDSQPPAPGT